MKKVNVLFVCLGNICRSPLAAAIFKHKIENNGMSDWVRVDSCGTSDYHIGDTADPRAIASALRHGIPVDHCVRQFASEDADKFDFIFAMDKSNYQNILMASRSKNVAEKLRMMRDFDPEEKGGEVPDPYHGGEKDFQEVFDILDRSTDHFIAFLQKEYRK